METVAFIVEDKNFEVASLQHLPLNNRFEDGKVCLLQHIRRQRFLENICPFIFVAEYNAGLISVAFALVFAGLYFAGKGKNSENAKEKEPYACGEILKPESAGEGMLYATIYKALGLEKIERLHNEGLNEYLSWMFIAVAVAVALFAVFGA